MGRIPGVRRPEAGGRRRTSALKATSALAVVAHPDDEAFGLGAVLAGLARGAEVRVLCLTHGEASTLGAADLVVVFEPSGVTGHPDHRAATAAAERVAARARVRVLEWGVAPAVALALNTEFGTAFVGFDGDDIVVDRTAQWLAIGCHASQARDNRVLLRRMAIQGDRDRVHLREGVDGEPA